MVVRDACPECGSDRYKKNGHTRHGKQNHQCKACERQFVATAEGHIIADEQRTLIERLLRERISLRGICRAVGVSLTWLLHLSWSALRLVLMTYIVTTNLFPRKRGL